MSSKTSQPKSRIKVGTYVGTGAATQAITGIGFLADCVIIGDQGVVADSWIKMSSMSANAKDLSTGNYTTNAIVSIDADGFTVALVNSLCTSGVTYFYLAMKN